MRVDTLSSLSQHRAQREIAVLVTHLDSGREALVVAGRRVAGDLDLTPDLTVSADVAADTDESRLIETESGQYFLKVHGPPLRMLVIGAVHIAQALVPMARLNAFDVVLIDPRAAFASESRFPGTRIITEWADKAMDTLQPDRRTAVVALTHDPKLDEPALASALKSPAFYVGALGSRRSAVSRNKRLAKLGFSDADMQRINGPVGLAIGARAPAEIATAIMAQIIKTLRTGAP